MANPKRSDRDVASRAGVSQPTVTRTRHRFEETGLIQSYEIIPDLAKLGLEIVAFSRVGSEANVAEDVRVVYAVKGIKMCAVKGIKNVLVMSVHQSYEDYANFAHKYKAEPVFLTITSATPVKPLSFKDILF